MTASSVLDPGRGATTGPLAVPRAFLRRDRRIETSYKAGFLLGAAASVMTVLIFYVLGGAIGAAAPGLDPYGAGYFSFVVLGLAVAQFVGSVISRIGGAVRESQVTGTLELMLLSPSRLSTIVVSGTLWANLSALTGALLFVGLGVLAGLAVTGTDVLVIAIAIPLTMIATTGLGIFAAASVVVLKRGNPLGAAITAACVVLGGVFYPVDALPAPLQALSALVPTTHALAAIRGAVLGGQDIVVLAGPLLALGVLAGASLLVGLVAFSAVIRFARTDGSLGQY